MKISVISIAVLLVGGAALAQVVPQPAPPQPIACAYNTSPPTLTSGQAGWTQCNASGAILTAPASGGGAQQVVGDSASGAADNASNPVKVGGVYTATGNALTAGMRGDLSLGARSALRVQIMTPDSTGVPVYVATNVDGVTPASTALIWQSAVYNYKFNGATWDRDFACNQNAVVNVTAAATTQIVGLTASQVIRVCSIAISMSAAGTATFVYGTGANCGTGTTSLSGAMPLATGVPLNLAGDLMRVPASNALCITAATGNVLGFISYAKY